MDAIMICDSTVTNFPRKNSKTKLMGTNIHPSRKTEIEKKDEKEEYNAVMNAKNNLILTSLNADINESNLNHTQEIELHPEHPTIRHSISMPLFSHQSDIDLLQSSKSCSERAVSPRLNTSQLLFSVDSINNGNNNTTTDNGVITESMNQNNNDSNHPSNPPYSAVNRNIVIKNINSDTANNNTTNTNTNNTVSNNSIDNITSSDTNKDTGNSTTKNTSNTNNNRNNNNNINHLLQHNSNLSNILQGDLPQDILDNFEMPSGTLNI